MNHMSNKYFKLFFLGLCSVIIVALLQSDALAMEEEISKGRRLWDNILLWVNFGILVFLFIKYAKNPLMNFLHNERKKINETLQTVNSRLDQVRSVMNNEADKLKDIDKRINEIRENIINLGIVEKERIMERAKINADQMVKDAQKESSYKLDMAKKALKDEMVDMAIAMVEVRLIKEISHEDNKKLVNNFISGLGMTKSIFI